MNNFKDNLYRLLKKDSRIWNKETKEINEILLKDLADKLDENLIGLLFQDKQLKEKFFVKIKDIFVFKLNDFKFFIDENKLDNSYTQYQNKIGLRVGNKLLSERDEVVLDFPYKDCVLEGGMTKEDQKRNEIFFNEILAKDEIDRLYDQKMFKNWKRYTTKGYKNIKELKRDEDGTIKENLIIKGNNLLALHSLRKQFAGKVKLIYIDPPFNTGNDSFGYNDRFNHSTWLTFMKNRLEVARELLRNDGIISVHVGNEESAYVQVLLDGIFKRENYLNHITITTNAPSGFKATSAKIFSTANHIFFYSKEAENVGFNKLYVKKEYDINYKYYLVNPNEPYSKWKYKSIIETIAKNEGFNNTNLFKKGLSGETLFEKIKLFADLNKERVFRTAALGGGALKKRKNTVEKSKKEKGIIFQHPNEDVKGFYILNGEQIVFWVNTYKKVEGETVPATTLTDVWSDVGFTGIANEGGITLKNGKKPEPFLKRIIELGTHENDIVLDYHAGSGTTLAVAHKTGRQYIGIEQLDYEENNPEARLENVVDGDTTGISKAVNWKGGGDFIYCELAEWNKEAKRKILKAKNLKELIKLFDELYEKYFLNYNVETKKFVEKTINEEGFKSKSLNEQKKLFADMLDMNEMYINYSEREDKKYELSKEDIALTEEFYN